jgi:hypothetical protein
MGTSEWTDPLQQKSTPPTWQFEGPSSGLTSTSAGGCSRSEIIKFHINSEKQTVDLLSAKFDTTNRVTGFDLCPIQRINI